MTTTTQRLSTLLRERAARDRKKSGSQPPTSFRNELEVAPAVHSFSGGLGYEVAVEAQHAADQQGRGWRAGIVHWDMDGDLAASGGDHRLSRDEMLTLAPVDVKAVLLTPSDPLAA